MTIHLCIYECGSRDLYCSPPYVLRQGLLLNLKIIDSATLAGPSVSVPSCEEYRSVAWCLAFYVGCGDLNCMLWELSVCLHSKCVIN